MSHFSLLDWHTKKEDILPLCPCFRGSRWKAVHGIFLLPTHRDSKTLQTYLRWNWDVHFMGILVAADLISGSPKSLRSFMASSAMAPGKYNTEEGHLLREGIKTSDSSSINLHNFHIPCPGDLSWRYLWVGIICFVFLLLFLSRKVFKHLFLESLRRFQGVYVGVCVERLAMLPQYHLGEVLHDHILPSFPMWTVHSTSKDITWSYTQKKEAFFCLAPSSQYWELWPWDSMVLKAV